jgi:hypothetical protein
VGAFRAAACENLEEMTKTVSESNVDKKKLAKASNDKTLLNCFMISRLELSEHAAAHIFIRLN